MDEQDLINTFTQIFGIISIVVAVVGTLGNLTTGFICLKSNLRKTPTFIFSAFSSIIEIVPLLTLNLNGFSLAFFLKRNISDLNVYSCYIMNFLHFWALQSSAYILVANAVDRYLSVRIILWRKVYFNSTKAFIVASIIVIIFFFIHFHMLTDLVNDPMVLNTTLFTVCSATKTMQAALSWNPYVAVFVPFGLLLTFNILLVFTLARKRMSKSVNSKKQRGLNLTIIITNTTFIILNTPSAIFAAYFIYLARTTKTGNLILRAVNLLIYIYGASNIFVQTAFNEMFSKEFKSIFCKKNSSNQANTCKSTNI